MQHVFDRLKSKESTIGVVGLGYVGLPLACLLAEKFKVVGFDIKEARVAELKSGHDSTREVEQKERLINTELTYTTDSSELSKCSVIIVAVPTPIDDFKTPDLTPVTAASRTVGKILQKGTIVCFESTVYPGVTEDVCGPILAKESGLTYGKDFFLGYSPERVNPGDKEHTIDKIIKVVSGSTPEVADTLCNMYGSIVTAGIHRAATIKTAEAAKVIENTQRDLNIALINELSMIFNRAGIDTLDVLEAAGTKWNFLKFKPGLVGGHCIGVDPYYLTHMAEGLGHHSQTILAGRRINDNMGRHIAEETIKIVLEENESHNERLKIGVMGVTFKENVPDLRNTKVIDVINTLDSYGARTHCFDPVAIPGEFNEEYGRTVTQSWDDIPECDAMILAVYHKAFTEEFPISRIRDKMGKHPVIIDVKGVLDRDEAKSLGIRLWRL